MSAMNIKDLKRMLNHLPDEALLVVATDQLDRDVPVDPEWFLFDQRGKRLILKGPLVHMDEQLEQDLAAISEIRVRLRGWEQDEGAGQRERLRDIAKLLDTSD